MGTIKIQLTRNKILYLILAAILVILLSYAIWGFIGNRVFSSTVLRVNNLTISKNELLANGKDTSVVKIAIITQDNNSLIADVWVGLNIINTEMATEELSYFGWYSPEPGRAFYQTNKNGEVKFNIKSKMAGDITYGIYAANPQQQNRGKYQSLNKEFTLKFE